MNGRLSGDSGHTSDEIGALQDDDDLGKLVDSPSSQGQSQSPITSSSRLGGKILATYCSKKHSFFKSGKYIAKLYKTGDDRFCIKC